MRLSVVGLVAWLFDCHANVYHDFHYDYHHHDYDLFFRMHNAQLTQIPSRVREASSTLTHFEVMANPKFKYRAVNIERERERDKRV